MATSLEVAKLCTPKDVGLYYIRHRLQRENAEQMARLLAAEKQEGARWPFPDLLGFRLAEPAEDDTSPKAKAYRAGARYVVLDGVTRLAAAREAKWEKVPVDIEEKEPDPKRIVLTQLGENFAHGVPLTPDEKAEAVRVALKEGASREDIARVVRLHPSSISRIRAGKQGQPREEVSAKRRQAARARHAKRKDERPAPSDGWTPAVWLRELARVTDEGRRRRKALSDHLDAKATAGTRGLFKTAITLLTALAETAETT